MKETKPTRIEVLEMIATDMKKDAEHFDGQAFNERNVAEYFGRHGAAIAALANIIKSILKHKKARRTVPCPRCMGKDEVVGCRYCSICGRDLRK